MNDKLFFQIHVITYINISNYIHKSKCFIYVLFLQSSSVISPFKILVIIFTYFNGTFYTLLFLELKLNNIHIAVSKDHCPYRLKIDRLKFSLVRKTHKYLQFDSSYWVDIGRSVSSCVDIVNTLSCKNNWIRVSHQASPFNSWTAGQFSKCC